MIVLIILLIGYHLYQFYLRNILFYAKPKIVNESFETVLRSPAHGRVVYCDKVRMSKDRKIIKQGRKIDCPYDLEIGENYWHLGIFMSPFNNHHLVTMNNSQKIISQEYVSGEWNDMWDQEDNKAFSNWWKDWFNKKVNKWIEKNARVVFKTNNGVVLAVIFDKYVNKIDIFKDTNCPVRHEIGFVYRGSQTDIFIKASEVKYVLVNVGDKVDFNDELFELED